MKAAIRSISISEGPVPGGKAPCIAGTDASAFWMALELPAPLWIPLTLLVRDAAAWQPD